VHLPGKADAGDFLRAETSASKRFANRDARGAPPVFRTLFCPTNLGRSKGLVLFRGGGDDAAAAIDDEGARSSRTNVNPQ